MKIIKINERINTDTVSKVIDAYNSCDDGKIATYLCSHGGCTASMEVILDILNSNQESLLIGYGQICSSAFELFFTATCKTRLLAGATGMYHMGSVEVQMNEKWLAEYKEGDAQKKFMTGFMREKTKAFCERLKMTDSEIRKINKGDDVWFDTNRMIEFQKISTPTLKTYICPTI